MKKILMGLSAVTTLCFAATGDVNLGNNASPNTNVFQSGQTGKIDVTGSLTSTVPVIKYVVFATTDEGATVRKDTLELSEFILKVNGTDGGFSNINPKVMVKRVNTNSSDIENLGTENIEFSLVFDPNYADFTNNKIAKGGSLSVVPTALIFKTDLENLAKSVDGSLKVSGSGFIFKEFNGSKWQAFKTTKQVLFTSPQNGVLEVKDEKWRLISHYDSLPENTSNKILTQFAGGKSLSAFSIKVSIK